MLSYCITTDLSSIQAVSNLSTTTTNLSLLYMQSADNLPDVLDIEQPEKPVSPGQCSSVKAANVTGESSSSSFPSESAVAT